ncbi:hypothetical protein [Nonomuraea rubra]|uniref:hypothetical protein n=1 Tax=Nonomuraea rubra TaxID=46180 RepID=UPI0031EF4107
MIASGSVLVRQSMTASATAITAKHTYGGPARHAASAATAAQTSSSAGHRRAAARASPAE